MNIGLEFSDIGFSAVTEFQLFKDHFSFFLLKNAILVPMNMKNTDKWILMKTERISITNWKF